MMSRENVYAEKVELNFEKIRGLSLL